MTTRRMSGMLAAAGPAAPALLEQIDAFKRKHVSQNKEIIHKNSGLMRSNSDLSAKLAALQEELMAAKAENLELAATNCQLTAKLEVLRAQLKQAHQELQENQFTALALPQGHTDTFKATLDAVVGQLQNMQALYSTVTAAESFPRKYPPISPPDSPESQLAQSTSTPPLPSSSSDASTSSSMGNRPRSSTAIVSAPPDLSFISEGSQEPSLSSSQAGYVPYDDYYGMNEEELQEQEDINPIDQPPSQDSKFERTPSPETEIRWSPSFSPTPSPPPIPPSASSISETAARQSRRRNSGVLPPPPGDLAQRKRRTSVSETQSADMLEVPLSPPKKPSLLADLGITPASLSLSSNEDLSVRRIRENSPTLVLQEATPPAAQEKLAPITADLTRTVRASAGMEALDALAASGGLLAPTAATQRNVGQRSRSAVTKPVITAESISKSQKKGPLVGAMQGRPVSTSLVSLNGHIVPEGENLKESKETDVASTSALGKPKIRHTGSIIHRRLSSKSAEANTTSPPSVAAESKAAASSSSMLGMSDRTARARSTTPEMEPPSISSVLQDFCPASLQQQQQPTLSDNPKAQKGKNVVEKASGGSVVKQRVSRENLTAGVAGRSRCRSTITAAEADGEAKDVVLRDSQSQEAASETSTVSLSGSQEDSTRGASAAATAAREGRRARGAVNYQEPSLSKKMRAPAGYVKTVASKRSQHHPGTTLASGVRRKSSLEAMTGRAVDNPRQDNSEGDVSDRSEE